MVVYVGDRKVASATWAAMSYDEQEAFRAEVRAKREAAQRAEDVRVIAHAAAHPVSAEERERLHRMLDDMLDVLPEEEPERCAREDRDGRCDLMARPGKKTCAKHARFEKEVR